MLGDDPNTLQKLILSEGFTCSAMANSRNAICGQKGLDATLFPKRTEKVDFKEADTTLGTKNSEGLYLIVLPFADF